MCSNTFVNLHVHTAFSLLDSISRPEDIIKKIKVMNQPAVAITEHGNTYSSVLMHKLAKKNDVKHIYGCEFYITHDRFVKDKDNKYYHLTVLAKNEQGRLNINKLVTLANTEGFYYKPRVDIALLEAYSEGLVVMSGCMAGELQQTLAGHTRIIHGVPVEVTHENIRKALSVIVKYRSIFGDDYYLEVQSHSDDNQQILNREIANLSKATGIKLVATSDSHFINEDDLDLHRVFIGINQSKDDWEKNETYKDTQLQSIDEVRKLLKPALTDEEIDIAIASTMEITDKCNAKIPLSAPLIPHVKVPPQYKSEDDYLQHLCQVGWQKRRIHTYPDWKKKEYKERLMYEFNAIRDMGFSGYFLLVYSYCNSVKRRGIARGSAGGSLVAYLLNIVDIDPIRFGLYFERFIDVGALDLLAQGIITPEELKIPDVDSDFGTKDRELVLRHIINEYGEDHVVALGNFGYIWDKSAIKDVGRVTGVPYEVTNEITKLLGDEDIDFAMKSSTFKKYRDQYSELFDYASRLTGLPRSFGVHPCGKVVTIEESTYYSALVEKDGQMVIQMDMRDAESLGLVKADLLGLKTIDVIYDTLDLIGKDYEYINPSELDFEDPNILEIFRQGRTNGIFQFESDGMKGMLKKMRPTGIEDLSVANALYRPGSLRYIEHYIKRKHGEETFEFLHPDLEQILKVTYGIIVYQEQLIEIGKIAGLRNPDEIRKATAKKDIEKMKKVEPQMKGGLLDRGWTQAQVDKLWEDILEFVKYSFNKSHAVAYAQIAFITAKLKAYHPVEFMTALLTSEIGNYDKTAIYIQETKTMGIEVLKPHINKSERVYIVESGKILFGLEAIRGVGESAVDIIVEERGMNGKYKSFIDFTSRVTSDTGTNIALIQSGCFGSKNKEDVILQYADSLFEHKEFKPVKSIPTKAKLMEVGIITTDEEFKDKANCLAQWNSHKEQAYIKIQHAKYEKHIKEWTEKYMSNPEMYEYNTLSVFLSGSPFDGYENLLVHPSLVPNDKRILLGGTIINVVRKKQRSGGQMSSMNLLTNHGMYALTAFASTTSEFQEFIKKGKNVIVLAKSTDKENQFIVDKMKDLESWKEYVNSKKNGELFLAIQ